MKKALLSVLFFLTVSMAGLVYGQGKVDVKIVATGGIATDTNFVEDDQGNIIDTLVFEFPTSSDDAEQENDEIDALFDDDLDAGWEGQEGDENTLTLGLRFQNITIPKDAKIDSAFILMYSHEAKLEDDVAKITIYADATDNAITFSEDSLITDREATTAKVKWTVEEEWKLWEAYSTPDLASVVQEIVNRSGWVSGNAIAFVLAGENQGASDVENAREMESFENIADPEDEDENGNPGDGKNHPERVPRLVVYYDGYSSSVNAVTNAQLGVFPTTVENGEIKVQFDAAAANNISIINNLGQVVYSQEETVYSGAYINVDHLSGGIYFIKLSSGNKTFVGRFIKK